MVRAKLGILSLLYLTHMMFASFFLAIISIKKDLQNNKAICDMVDKALNKDTVLEVDKLQDTKEAYGAFVQVFGQCIVPKAKFKRMICGTQDAYETSYTAEDEALALVILENNIEKWSAENNKALLANANHPDAILTYKLSAAEKEDIPQSKYTMGTSTNNNLRSGWNSKGIKKYTFFLKQTKTFREANDLFTSCKEHAIEEIKPTFMGNKRKRARIEEVDTAVDGDNEDDNVDPYDELQEVCFVFEA